MVLRDTCPGCGSPQFKENGHIHSGKQHHQKACGRQFVASAEDHIVSDEARTVVEHLLRERISLRGICRAVGVSLTWLLHCMVERCNNTLSQRMSRLVRDTLSCSKKLANHVGTIKFFIRHDNLTKAAALPV